MKIYEIKMSYTDYEKERKTIKLQVRVSQECRACDSNGYHSWTFFEGCQLNENSKEGFQVKHKNHRYINFVSGVLEHSGDTSNLYLLTFAKLNDKKTCKSQVVQISFEDIGQDGIGASGQIEVYANGKLSKSKRVYNAGEAAIEEIKTIDLSLEEQNRLQEATEACEKMACCNAPFKFNYSIYLSLKDYLKEKNGNADKQGDKNL